MKKFALIILILCSTCFGKILRSKAQGFDAFEKTGGRITVYDFNATEVALSIGFAEGQILYWNDTTKMWTASDVTKLKWTASSNTLLADTITTSLITGADVDISGGTGTWLTTGNLGSGAHTITSATDPQFTINNADGTPDEFTVVVAADGTVLMTTSTGDFRLAAGNMVVSLRNNTNLLFAGGSGNIGTGGGVGFDPLNIWAMTNITAGGQFLAAAGTTGAPSISFKDDPDTGIFNGGSGFVGFTSNGDAAGSISATVWTLANNANLLVQGTGIVTAGEFNTTGSTGNTGTLASFGVANASPDVRQAGLLELISDSGQMLPSDLNNALVAEAYFDGATSYPSLFHSALFARTFVSGSIGTLKAYNGLFGQITSTLTPTGSSSTPVIFGLNFDAGHDGDWINSSGRSGPAMLGVIALQALADWGTANTEISGSLAGATLDGVKTVVTMSGEYSGSVAGEVAGVRVSIVDSLNDPCSASNVNAYGIHITVPATNVMAGGGTLTSWTLYGASDVPSFLLGDLYFGQTDGAEKVTSDADGTLDLYAGTSISFNIGGSEDMVLNANSLDMQGSVITDLAGLHFNSTTELTISSGAVTVTQGHHSIDTEGDAANDDLDTINGGNAGEILLILPADDNRTVRIRHAVGNIFLKHQVESKSYSFSSPAGSSGVFYSGGYYNWSGTDGNLTQASLSVTHSAANSPSACHIGIVAGGAGVVDTGVVKLTVSGTTIDDDGNRLASQTVILVADITTLSLNQYVETTEKWLGQVTIALAIASGSPVNFSLDINYGCSKYEDFGNQAFTINVLEVVGLAGANDTGFNLRLFHHSSAGWTYAASGFVPGGTVLANMNSDYSTEQDLANGESFAYKRVDLNTDISGDDSEGLILEITTGANKAVEIMDMHFGVHTAPNFSYMATTKQHLIFMKHGPRWLEL